MDEHEGALVPLQVPETCNKEDGDDTVLIEGTAQLLATEAEKLAI